MAAQNNYNDLKRENAELREHLTKSQTWLVTLTVIGGLTLAIFLLLSISQTT